MIRPRHAIVALVLMGSPVDAQDAPAAPEPVYQEEKAVRLKVDAVLRQEWTADVFQAPGVDRWRVRVLPRLELGRGRAALVIGGDFIYSNDQNTGENLERGEFDYGGGGGVPPPAAPALPLIRDNYRSRDARLDLAAVRLTPARWVTFNAGRFEMPVPLTEMTWDRDLRPQGGGLTLELGEHGGARGVRLTALGARGSHVFADQDTSLFLGAADAAFKLGETGRLQVLAAFLKFADAQGLETPIRRQNTRRDGELVREYDIADLVVRVRREGSVPLQAVAEVCWNTAVDDANRGIWLSLLAGSAARVRADYTYALVDPDATLAAYGADDFLWVTGWEGHRGELGVRLADHLTLHTIGHVLRFKDSPRLAERDVWAKRLRLELRASY